MFMFRCLKRVAHATSHSDCFRARNTSRNRRQTWKRRTRTVELRRLLSTQAVLNCGKPNPRDGAASTTRRGRPAQILSALSEAAGGSLVRSATSQNMGTGSFLARSRFRQSCVHVLLRIKILVIYDRHSKPTHSSILQT